MTTNLKRFSISLTPEMKSDLAHIKKSFFNSKPQSQMIRELIIQGLQSAANDNVDQTSDNDSSLV